MASADRARHGSYLFQRPGSSNWYIQLRSPDGRKVVSLRTADKLEAESAAAPMIGEHKAKLLAARPRFDTVWKHALEPGREHAGPDGGKIVATDKELIHIGHNGNVLKIEPNGARALQLVNKGENVGEANWRLAAAFLNDDGSLRFDKAARPVVATKIGDDALLETYIKHTGIGPAAPGSRQSTRESQARDIWHIFKTVVKKPITKCTRDDGRDIIAHLEASGVSKSATLRRRMVPLVATVNLAIDEGKLTFNPFSGVVPDRNDEKEREAFSDDDMKVIRANLRKLSENDQLLVRLLATTGIRRGEAFEICSEEKENRIRFVTIGAKTPQSVRRVPFPKDLLPHLPKKITGQLIQGRMDTAGKRLKNWLHQIGITDPDKAPMHSFRHRAAKRMRAAGIPEDVREAVGGWANGKKKKPSRKYGNKHGAGYPLSMLKEAIDKIGF